MLSHSVMLWNEQNGTRPLKDLANQSQMTAALSKTNPVYQNKAKAFDLVSPAPN